MILTWCICDHQYTFFKFLNILVGDPSNICIKSNSFWLCLLNLSVFSSLSSSSNSWDVSAEYPSCLNCRSIWCRVIDTIALWLSIIVIFLQLDYKPSTVSNTSLQLGSNFKLFKSLDDAVFTGVVSVLILR